MTPPLSKPPGGAPFTGLCAQENILGSLNLLQAAAVAGMEKFIFASTGGDIYGDDAPLTASEADRPRPEAPYGIAKLAVEHYLHFYQPV